ncbi:MAG TPA: hypothetical protein VN281_15930 [Verrucomicrobiae bacterium]|nr:hypothetical protein [Verrucomicrobiae bacterium]
MKSSHLIMLCFFAAGSASAQFDSGSTGSYGPMNVVSNTTLDLPGNGVFNCTTITVASNATLRFNRNTNNTPVYLLATGDVSVMGTIDVSGGSAPANTPYQGGTGGPGGFDGGWPGYGGNPPGDGFGPGGGKGGLDAQGSVQGGYSSAGAGSYYSTAVGPYNTYFDGYASTNKGALYGSPLLVPLVGGSGGGGTIGSPGEGGGGGGGGVLIASTTSIDVSGTIRADGGDGLIFASVVHLNPGSGGAIRLVAPVVAGTGVLSANGPGGSDPVYNYGRVRIDSIDRRYLNFAITAGSSFGNYMVVFPPSRLDVINVAGTTIPQGSGPVSIVLTNGASPNQTIVVQARNFNTNSLVVSVVLTPQSGPSLSYQTNLDNLANNPASVIVPVTFPVSTPVTVSAWTKVP